MGTTRAFRSFWPNLIADAVLIPRLVNYAKRYRAGERVGTSITEGTANFLVNRRMNKSQQMRWSRDGADLLLQVRCAVYNGTLGAGFGHRFDRIVKADPAFAQAA